MDRSTKDSRQAEYLKSKIRIPKSKICFWKFLFFDQIGCPLSRRPPLLWNYSIFKAIQI